MDTFRCKHCGFAAAVEVPPKVELSLFRCPLCARFGRRIGFAISVLGWSSVVAVPITAMLAVMVGIAATHLYRCRTLLMPAIIAGILAVLLLLAFFPQWLKGHEEARTKVQLRRFWEWQLPAGPRVVAAQDPGSGDDAVWIEGIRAAPSDGYVIPLGRAATGDPYRATNAHAKLVFPAGRTCWLTVGGKRVEPVRTSSDVV